MNSTTIADVTRRLSVLVQGTKNANNQTNLADFIWMLKHGNMISNWDEVWAAMCNEFEDLNTLINAGPDNDISRQLVYAANGLINLCVEGASSPQFEEHIRHKLLQLAWRISTAWDAVIAGDIDTIGEHVELERHAREIF
jgi:hypothetical protein